MPMSVPHSPNAALSPFLQRAKPMMQSIIATLEKEYAFVSILGTDVAGTRYGLSRYDCTIRDALWNSRGFVIRVYKDGAFSEYAFNHIPDDLNEISEALKFSKLRSFESFQYPEYEESPLVDSYTGPCLIRPNTWTVSQHIDAMKNMLARGLAISEAVVDLKLAIEETEWNKLYLSGKRELSQNYRMVQCYINPIVREGENTKYAFRGIARQGGLEIVEEMEQAIEPTLREALMLLKSEPIPPGVYEVICSPEISGLLAHEAFGHGVEMDMFVKRRAKSVAYLGKPIGSPLVRMHDGARAAANQPGSYLFDDEGVLGSDTTIIEDGIFKSGISDLLSALRLKTPPTGNGRRESYERKAYARMTNTFFQPGKQTKDEMIRSISDGVLLEKMASGMEDPKNWGIQCMIHYGHEIKDGRVTGRVFSPIIMTGYVPDLLADISMVSGDFELSGSGACGKGYKEFVKVSDGGPYIKTKARLG